MKKGSVVLVVALNLLGACRRGDNGEHPAPSSTTAMPKAPLPADASGWMGRWVNDGCGARKYRRVLELKADDVASGEDLVSPCPKDVACVWSGIIPFEGTWALKGDRVSLKLEPTAYKEQARALPIELTWDGAPVGRESGATCVYRSSSAPGG